METFEERIRSIDTRQWRIIINAMVNLQPLPNEIPIAYATQIDIDDQIKAFYGYIRENNYDVEPFWDGLMETFTTIVPISGGIASKTNREDIFLLLNIIGNVTPKTTKKTDYYNVLFNYVQRKTLLDVFYSGANLHFKLLNALVPYGHTHTLEKYYWVAAQKSDITSYPNFYETAVRFYCQNATEKLPAFLNLIFPAFTNEVKTRYAMRALFEYSVSTSFYTVLRFVKERQNIEIENYDDVHSTSFANITNLLITWIGNRWSLAETDTDCKALSDLCIVSIQYMTNKKLEEQINKNSPSILTDIRNYAENCAGR